MSRRVLGTTLGAVLVVLATVTVLGAWVVIVNGLGAGASGNSQDLPARLVPAAAALVAAASASALLAQRSASTASGLAVVAVCAATAAMDRWSATPAALSSILASLFPLIVPALFVLATISRPRWRAARIAITVAALALTAVILCFRDPFLDPLCTASCGTNPFAIEPRPEIVRGARWLVAALGIVATVIAIPALAPAARAMWRAPRSVMGTLSAIAGLSAVVTLAVETCTVIATAAWVDGWVAELEELGEPWIIALSILGAAHLAASVEIAHRRAAVVALADALTAGSARGAGVVDRLRIALRDPGARVMYPLDGARLVDDEGLPAAASPNGQAVTEVRRDDETVALIVHSVRMDGGELATAFGPAAALAFSNARVRAGIRAKILELQALRMRVVDAGDATRREIERNLHDGVQQTLLVLQYELALAAAQAEPEIKQRLERIGEGVRNLTERTRELGHGIYPMSLDDVGLEAALQRLADDSPVPFEPVVDLTTRPPRAVERTAYLIARDALTDPRRASIDIRRGSDSVAVNVVGGSPSALSRDRIDALGGTLERFGRTTKVVLPCESSSLMTPS